MGSNVSLFKLQSLLETSIKASVVGQDQYHEDVRCMLLSNTLTQQLLKHLPHQVSEEDVDEEARTDMSNVFSDVNDPGSTVQFDSNSSENVSQSLTRQQAFCLSYNMPWPLSLIFPPKVQSSYHV